MVMPTADGTAGQVLQTDGSNALSWVNRTDITGKTDRTDFNAHVAQAMVTTGHNAPALDNTYDLGVASTNSWRHLYIQGNIYSDDAMSINSTAGDISLVPAENVIV